MKRPTVFAFLLLVCRLLSGTAFSEEVDSEYPLVLRILADDSEIMEKIAWEELISLSTHTASLALEIDSAQRQMTYVYLSDFVEKFTPNPSIDFWLANCSDGYQSNFRPETIDSAKPYLILKVDDVPIWEWLDSIGHPEWGPYIINTEDNTGLRDPGHKNPWGVEEIVAMTIDQATSRLPDAMDNHLGLDIFLNACISCHNVDESVLGGSVSTRNSQLIGQFAKHSEGYFQRMLDDPVGTNPLAKKMPSYKHYTQEEYQSIRDYLASFAK